MASSLSVGPMTVDPLQVVGLQRSAALARIMHFEATMHRRLGVLRPQRYYRLWGYYSSQNLPPDNVEQPLGVNYVRAICDKHVSYLWGQYTDDIVGLRVRPRPSLKEAAPEDATSLTIQQWQLDQLRANHHNILFQETATNGSIFGDGVLRLRWDAVQRRVIVDSLLPEWVHFRWNVTNMDEVTEVIVAYPIDRLDAQEQFGTSGNPAINYNLINPEYTPGFGIFWEHWTPTTYRRWIDDICIEQAPNPYIMTDTEGHVFPGILPFIHIPNLRAAGEFYGFSDAELILFLQDELNRKLADMGDSINNHAHPVVLVNKYLGDVEGDLKVGPDAVWDMGREGAAEYLQWKGTPPAAIEYLQMLKDAMFDTANMPDIAFGRMVRGGQGSSSGGGRGMVSGIALQIALMPVIERAKQKRLHWDLAIRKLLQMLTFIHAVMDPATLPFDYAVYAKDYESTPVFASILPRDRMQQVQENVQLVQQNMRSRERALDDLGETNIANELNNITTDMRFIASLAPQATGPMNGIAQTSGGKNSDTGHGGNSANPQQ